MSFLLDHPSRIVLFLCALFVVPFAQGHQSGVTYTNIDVTRSGIKLIYTVPSVLLESLRTAPAGNKSTDPLTSLQSAVLNGFDIRNNNQPCAPITASIRVLETIGSEQFSFSLDCGGYVRHLSIEYRLHFDEDAAHKNLGRINVLQNFQNVTFSNDNRLHQFDIEKVVRRLADSKKSGNEASLEKTVLVSSNYFFTGLEHILRGYDHLLFLFVLVLLPMTLTQLLLLVTSFTIAHSLTLAASVLSFVKLEPSVVELCIALSIVIVAIDSFVYLREHGSTSLSETAFRRRLYATCIFGLVHGFGFSFLLNEIGLAEQLLSTLVFFNLGVEFGQLLVLIVVLPVIFFLFSSVQHVHWAQLACVVFGFVGLVWMGKRMIAAV